MNDKAYKKLVETIEKDDKVIKVVKSDKGYAMYPVYFTLTTIGSILAIVALILLVIGLIAQIQLVSIVAILILCLLVAVILIPVLIAFVNLKERKKTYWVITEKGVVTVSANKKSHVEDTVLTSYEIMKESIKTFNKMQGYYGQGVADINIYPNNGDEKVAILTLKSVAKAEKLNNLINEKIKEHNK